MTNPSPTSDTTATDRPAIEPPPPHEPAPEDGPVGGSTWISDTIVAKIAGLAAIEVDGVAGLRTDGGGRGWGKGSKQTDEATVTVTDGQAAIDLRLVVVDRVNIPTVVEQVRQRVISRVQDATGMRVTAVDIGVVDVVAGTEASE